MRDLPPRVQRVGLEERLEHERAAGAAITIGGVERRRGAVAASTSSNGQ